MSCHIIISCCCHGAMECNQKSFKPVCQCHQFLSGLLPSGHLSQVPNDKGDNEIKLGAMLRSIGIYLRAKSIHRAKDCSLKSFKIVWRCYQLIQALTQWPLAQVSCQTHLPANNKDDN